MLYDGLTEEEKIVLEKILNDEELMKDKAKELVRQSTKDLFLQIYCSPTSIREELLEQVVIDAKMLNEKYVKNEIEIAKDAIGKILEYSLV